MTGEAVGRDPIRGWMTVSQALSSLKDYEQHFKAAKRTCDATGSPVGRGSLIIQAKQALDAFFSLGAIAFQWGKFHYGDASGGPGQRARMEEGFAQKAALTRVTNNGKKFAENALGAAKAGRAFLELVSVERYRGTGPSLMEIFVNAVDDLRPLLGQRAIRLSHVSTTGAWCFSQAAILGMAVRRDPEEFISMVWDPARIDKFWLSVDEELNRIDAAELTASSLGYVRMRTGYAELHDPEVFAAALASGDLKRLERLADSRVDIADARGRWAIDTALGLGLGIRRPEFTRACMQTQAEPDKEAWTRAHDAGVDIPAEPDAQSVGDQIEGVLEVCRFFFEEYYPQAKAKLDALTA